MLSSSLKIWPFVDLFGIEALPNAHAHLKEKGNISVEEDYSSLFYLLYYTPQKLSFFLKLFISLLLCTKKYIILFSKTRPILFSRKLHAAKQNEKGILVNFLMKTQHFASLSLLISFLPHWAVQFIHMWSPPQSVLNSIHMKILK